jgi:Zn-finger nucleic acid-binding protein
MNCPSCGAPMRPDGDALRCDYCHSVAFPEKDDSGVRVLGEATGYVCPICDMPLMQATLAGVGLAYCTVCRGMSIPMQVFEEFLGALRGMPSGATASLSDASSSDLQRRIKCPHCHRGMTADWYAGPGHVVIDSCEPCLLNWLDHGELMRIAQGADSFETVGAEGAVFSR